MTLSLWFTPPPNDPITSQLRSLITTLASNCPHVFPNSPVFPPHVTVVSGIPESVDPEEVMDKIMVELRRRMDVGPLGVEWEQAETGKTFYTRLYYPCKASPGLLGIAEYCRHAFVPDQSEEDAEKWVKETYYPHLSLAYAEPETGENKEAFEQVKGTEQELGIGKGWVGGKIALVDTSGKCEDWKVLGDRRVW